MSKWFLNWTPQKVLSICFGITVVLVIGVLLIHVNHGVIAEKTSETTCVETGLCSTDYYMVMEDGMLIQVVRSHWESFEQGQTVRFTALGLAIDFPLIGRIPMWNLWMGAT